MDPAIALLVGLGLAVLLVGLVVGAIVAAFRQGSTFLEPRVDKLTAELAGAERALVERDAQHAEDLDAEVAAHAATAERFRWFAHAAATDPILRGSLGALGGGGGADPDDVWAWVREHADPGPAAAPVEGGEDPAGPARAAGDAPADRDLG